MKSGATPATAFLAHEKVSYTEHSFEYVDHGGTEATSKALDIPEHAVVKTLVMETDQGDPLVVLMHGDRKVSTKELARQAGAKRIFPCKPEAAQRHTGYLIGGVSPFGMRRQMPIYAERSILALERLYINGGRRGYILGMDPAELARVLSLKLVDVALEE